MANFQDAVTAVLLNQPFFGQLLMRYDHVADDKIGTAAISRTAITYSPKYFEGLTDEQGIAAVTHEVLHGVYQHLDEIEIYHESNCGPDGKAFDASKYNEAADYVINDLIKQNKIGELCDTWCHDPAYTFTMTPGEVYKMLPSKPPGQQGQGRGPGGKPGGKQQSQDEHQSSRGDSSKPDAVTPMDIVQAAQTAEAMGQMPAGLDRLIDKLKKPSHSPWAVLRKQVMSAIGGHDTSSWKKLNRRLIGRGIGAPGHIAFGCNRVGIVVDTSGSIGAEILALFGGHMGAILSDARPKEIKVYWTDSEVHRVDTLKTGGALRTLLSQPVPGGGGTDMPRGINAAVADKCDAVVCLTDMYTPFGEPQRTPLIWGAITDIKAPHGTTVRLT